MPHPSRVALGAALLAVLACAGGTEATDNNNNPGGNQNPPNPPQGTPAPSATVAVNDDYYSPNSVLLAAGGTVTWNWVGTRGHSVTPDGPPSFTPTAGVSYPPTTLVVTFPTAGDYQYFCTVHGIPGAYGTGGSMIGGIFVR